MRSWWGCTGSRFWGVGCGVWGVGCGRLNHFNFEMLTPTLHTPHPRNSPAAARTQRGDVADMMPAVPRVHGDERIKRHDAHVWMHERAFEISIDHRAQDRVPSLVQRVEQDQ